MMFCLLLLFQKLFDEFVMGFCSFLSPSLLEEHLKMYTTTTDGFQKDRSVYFMLQSSRLAKNKNDCRSSHGFGCLKEPMELYMWALEELWF